MKFETRDHSILYQTFVQNKSEKNLDFVHCWQRGSLMALQEPQCSSFTPSHILYNSGHLGSAYLGIQSTNCF